MLYVVYEFYNILWYHSHATGYDCNIVSFSMVAVFGRTTIYTTTSITHAIVCWCWFLLERNPAKNLEKLVVKVGHCLVQNRVFF